MAGKRRFTNSAGIIKYFFFKQEATAPNQRNWTIVLPDTITAGNVTNLSYSAAAAPYGFPANFSLGGGGEKTYAYVLLSNNQGFSSNSTAKLNFNYVVADTKNIFNTSQLRFNIKETAYYSIAVGISESGAQAIAVGLRVNGSQVVATMNEASGNQGAGFPFIIRMNAGDYMEVFMFSYGGSTVYGNTSLTSRQLTFVQLCNL